MLTSSVLCSCKTRSPNSFLRISRLYGENGWFDIDLLLYFLFPLQDLVSGSAVDIQKCKYSLDIRTWFVWDVVHRFICRRFFWQRGRGSSRRATCTFNLGKCIVLWVCLNWPFVTEKPGRSRQARVQSVETVRLVIRSLLRWKSCYGKSWEHVGVLRSHASLSSSDVDGRCESVHISCRSKLGWTSRSRVETREFSGALWGPLCLFPCRDFLNCVPSQMIHVTFGQTGDSRLFNERKAKTESINIGFYI